MLTFPLIFWRMRAPWKSTFRRPRLAASVALWSLAGIGGSFLGPPLIHAQEISVEGKPVAGVRVVDETGQNIEQAPLASRSALAKPFASVSTEPRKACALCRMSTGNYSDIRVVTTPEGAGIGVDFVVRRNYYNNVVRILGLKRTAVQFERSARARQCD